jgi:hypothetical protein
LNLFSNLFIKRKHFTNYLLKKKNLIKKSNFIKKFKYDTLIDGHNLRCDSYCNEIGNKIYKELDFDENGIFNDKDLDYLDEEYCAIINSNIEQHLTKSIEIFEKQAEMFKKVFKFKFLIEDRLFIILSFLRLYYV